MGDGRFLGITHQVGEIFRDQGAGGALHVLPKVFRPQTLHYRLINFPDQALVYLVLQGMVKYRVHPMIRVLDFGKPGRW
jgi:hypothetical protein